MIFLELDDDSGGGINYADLTQVNHAFKTKNGTRELEVPVFSLRDEEIAYTVDDLLEILDPSNGDSDDAKLILCRANYAEPVDPALYYAEVLPDGTEAIDLPARVQVAFMELNEKLSEIREVISYAPGVKAPNQKSIKNFLKKNKVDEEPGEDDDE